VLRVVLRKSFEDVKVGDEAFFTKTISEADIYLYAGVTGDLSPIHVNEEYAKTTRFGTRIAPGIMTAGMITAVLGNDLVGCEPISISDNFRFLAPVKIGDTITAKMKVVDKIPEKRILKLEATCSNQDGVVVLTVEAAMIYPKETT